jgi:hypothetical protein
MVNHLEKIHLSFLKKCVVGDYLPSSRQIQRRFGGLKSLRGILGYETKGLTPFAEPEGFISIYDVR